MTRISIHGKFLSNLSSTDNLEVAILRKTLKDLLNVRDDEAILGHSAVLSLMPQASIECLKPQSAFFILYTAFLETNQINIDRLPSRTHEDINLSLSIGHNANPLVSACPDGKPILRNFATHPHKHTSTTTA